MSRVVKEADVRRDEILTTAQRIFYSKGYSKTSIRDIIDDIGIAKGTFYHHFSSKDMLLEEICERMLAQSTAIMQPFVDDPSLDAVTKLLRLYRAIGGWKTQERVAVMAVANALYRDENILLLHKLKQRAITATRPLVSHIIRQGIEEGVFDVEFVDDSAEIFMKTSQSFSETFGTILRSSEQYENPAQEVKNKKAAYESAMERILGAQPGSLSLFDVGIIDQWFVKTL